MSIEKSRQQYSIFWIMLLALLTALGPLSIDMYLPALPDMADDFNVSTEMIANTLPAYFLGLAIGQLVYGPISDRIGRKKPLYIGLTLYVIAGILCVFAQDEWSLIVLRVVQALGGCVGVVMARAAIRDRLDVDGAAQAFSSMMIVMGIAPIIAPILGAFILQFFDWHIIFVVLSIVGLICLACVHFFFEETLAPSKRLKLNFNQVLTLYGSILTDKSFKLPLLASCLTSGTLFSYISSASSVLMIQYELSQQEFAYAFAVNAFGIIILSSINKRLIRYVGTIQRLVIGAVIQFSGALIIIISGLFNDVPLWIVMIGLFFAVSGLGFTGPNAMALAMAKQGARAGTASAIMGSFQFFVGLLCGLLLFALNWTPLLNMGITMLVFTSLGLLVIRRIQVKFKSI